ncbi:MAG: type II secretion system protein [Rickettsiales bacterium]
MAAKRTQRGFSLIELAISVTIIGVIISFIVTVKGVMDDSKLKGIIADITYYQTSFTNFRNTYKSFPGDMANATDYWSTTCATVISCNGNGNGVIEYIYASSNSSELERAWKHLELGHVIKNGFAITTQNRSGLELAVSAPASAFPNTGYTIVGGTNIGGITGSFITSPFTSNINAIYVGASSGNIARSFDMGGLTASQAFYLDTKFDDGTINSGNATGNTTGALRTIAGYGSLGNDCITSGGYYNTTENDIPSCVVGVQLHD